MTRKTIALGFVAALALTTLCMTNSSIPAAGARAGSEAFDAATFDAAKTYKSKCVACHGAKAEKKFDATKSDDEHVQIILKGKKPEKPPNMPAYETKGITAEQAKSLLDYMKSLKQ